MARLVHFASAALLAFGLAGSIAQADTPRHQPSGDLLAYYNGVLVPIRLEAMPVSAWEPLLHQRERLGVFYDGFLCACNFQPPDTVGVCACFSLTPVLRSLDDGPLVRAISISVTLADPPPEDFRSYSQIETAARENRIHLWEGRGVYRLIVRGPHLSATGEGSAGALHGDRSLGLEKTFAAPDAQTTWGALKGIFR